MHEATTKVEAREKEAESRKVKARRLRRRRNGSGVRTAMEARRPQIGRGGDYRTEAISLEERTYMPRFPRQSVQYLPHQKGVKHLARRAGIYASVLSDNRGSIFVSQKICQLKGQSLERRSKAQGISAQNKNPHLLSRDGGHQKRDDIGDHKEAEHVVPPIGRSGKESCSAAGAPGDDMDDTRPCHLYIFSDTGTMLLARGIVYETTTVLHGVQLAEDEVKVTVDEVVVPNVVLLVPTDEFLTMEEAFKSFIA
ncbi:hypothetical protein LR48_Vigan03g078000 [Vigna angularis]|uniref:DUF8039 domain-containing protein n=1 Tax=Phaseolus angularis TaxID=3914 RepID=A0A0L9U3J7_PHAAN|nr:hypothetical protein LR48_Vigan03g078000 [Vigna angularis]